MMPLPECLATLRLHNSAARLRMVIEALPVALVVADRQGRIVLANREAANIFGYSEDSLVGRGIDVLVPEASRRLHHLHIQRFFDACVPRTVGVGREVRAVDSAGREFSVEIGVTPVDTDDGPLAVAAIMNVSDMRRIESELTMAHVVQQAMSPESQPKFDGCDIYGLSKPAQITGGDFFDFVPMAGSRLGVAVGDASGHGFAAALVTAATRSYLRALSRTEHSISQIVAITNQLLMRDLPEGRFVTLFIAKLDPDHKKLQYTGAGQAGYLFARDGRFKQSLDSTGPALGWFDDGKFPSTTVDIAAGDILLITTDGIEESMNPAAELFGRTRVREIVREHAAAKANEIVQELFTVVRRFRAAHSDDATAVVVKFGS